MRNCAVIIYVVDSFTEKDKHNLSQIIAMSNSFPSTQVFVVHNQKQILRQVELDDYVSNLSQLLELEKIKSYHLNQPAGQT